MLTIDVGLWICTSKKMKYTINTVYSHKHTFSHIHLNMNIQTKYYLLTLINKKNTHRKEGAFDRF